MSVSTLWRIAPASAECDIPRTTVISAIERGEIRTTTTGCGVPLVRLADVRKWMKKRHEVDGRRKTA